MFTQYLVSCTFLFAVPPGDAYLFLISCERPRAFRVSHAVILTRGAFSSVVLLPFAGEHGRGAGTAPALHARVPDLGVEPAVPRAESCRGSVLGVEPVPRPRAVLPSQPWCADVSPAAILGERLSWSRTGWLGANLFILFRRPTQRAGYWYRVLACPIGTYGPSGDPRRRDTRSSENGSCSRTECPATPFGKYMGLRRN